jgi:hypothetical protein
MHFSASELSKISQVTLILDLHYAFLETFGL